MARLKNEIASLHLTFIDARSPSDNENAEETLQDAVIVSENYFKLEGMLSSSTLTHQALFYSHPKRKHHDFVSF